MKKFLTILTVALLACSTVFAAVNFSGELKAGYTFVADENGDWTSHVMGQDGIDSNTTKLNLSIGDDAGIWNIGLEGNVNLDARLIGDITVDVLKAFGLETDWDFSVALLANDRVTGLRAYSNKSGFSLDRIRSNEPGLWTSFTVGYGDIVSVNVAGGPKLVGKEDGSNNVVGVKDTNVGDFIVSALVTPIDGLAVSGGYVFNGEEKISDVDGSKYGDGSFNVEVEADIAKLIGSDFTLGVGVADKYSLEGKANLVLAQVYGGMDFFTVAAEYGLVTAEGRTDHMFYVGADFNVLEGLTLNVYTGSTLLNETTEYADSFYVGGNVGYEIAGLGLNLNLQYAKGNGGIASLGDIAQGGVNTTGFSITPSVTVAF